MSETSYPPINLDNRTLGYVAIVLMLLCPPAGALLSYTDRYRSTPLLASHYGYLIGTFWKGLAIFAVALALFLLAGPSPMIAPAIWYALRCGRSLILLRHGDCIRDPSTWFI